MRTLLALVAAAAMIAAALYVRGGDGASPALPGGGGERPALVCVTELRDVCEAMAADVDVRVEEAGATTAALVSDSPPDADGWLTLAPWAGIVADARQRSGLVALPPPGDSPLARSPLVMVVARERAAVLEEACGELTWSCVGTNAGARWDSLGGSASWGKVKSGFADPDSSATGLLVLAQATSDRIGAPDFSARDLERDGVLSWLGRLASGTPPPGSAANTPLRQQLQFGAARFDVVGTTEAEAAQVQSPRGRDFAVRYPETLVVADVVLAPLRDSGGADRLLDMVEESGATALATAGWRVEGQPADLPQGAPALPETANLPAPGVLDRLRGTWGEIAR